MNANKKEDRNPKRLSFLMLMMNKLFVIIPIKNAKDDKNKSYVLPSIILTFVAIITNTVIEYFTGESIVITALTALALFGFAVKVEVPLFEMKVLMTSLLCL